MPKVWNMRDPARPRLTTEGGNAIYIGRPSQWGNPFVIGTDGNRAEVIQKYADSIKGCNFDSLKGCDLVCWCTPAPCHGDILLKLANED